MEDEILDLVAEETGGRIVDNSSDFSPNPPDNTSKENDLLEDPEDPNEDPGKPEDPEKPNEDPEKPQDDPKDTPEEPKDELSVINKTFGKEFKTVEEAREAFNKLNEVESLTEKSGKLDELQKKYDELYKQFDPRSHFANDNEYVRQMLLKKYPDYKPDVISEIVRHEDVSEINPIDAIRLQAKLKDGDIYRNDQEVNEMIEDTFDVDLSEDFEDLPSLQRNKILKAAKEAKVEFKKLKDEVKIPEEGYNPIADQEEKQKKEAEKTAQLAEQWKPMTTKIPELLDKVTITEKTKDGKEVELFHFDIGDEFKAQIKDVTDKIAERMAVTGADPSAEELNSVVQHYKDFYLKANFPKILKAYGEEQIAKLSEETDKDIHNPRQTKPASPTRQTTSAKMREKAEAEIENDL